MMDNRDKDKDHHSEPFLSPYHTQNQEPYPYTNSPYHEQPPRNDKRKAFSWMGGIGAILLLVFTKLKTVLGLVLIVLKPLAIFLKLSKFAGTFISMFLMIWVYSFIYGWWFALGFVILLLIHEYGHLWFARMKNIKTGKPIFIPFVGALIALKEQPKNASDEAFIAIGGPVLGGLAAIGCLGIYFLVDSTFWLALAYVGLFLNLFNLVPVHPLDGGRIATALSTKLWLIGLLILLYLTFKTFNPILVLILIVGSFQAWKTYKEKKAGNTTYYDIPAKDRWIYGFLYIAWTGVLGSLMVYTLTLLQQHQPII